MEPSYEEYQYWTKYQPFFPEEYRTPSPNPAPKEEWWSWNGYRVHLDRVDVSGSPLKIIAVHGAGGYGRLLAPFCFMLSQKAYSYVAPDLPGYGLTTPRGNSLEYSHWVDAISDLVDHEIRRDGLPVVLMGLSLGGMLAYQAAAKSKKASGVIVTTLMDVREPAAVKAVSKHETFGALSIGLMKHLRFLADPLMVPIAHVSKMNRMSHNSDFNRIVMKDRVGGGNWIPVKFLNEITSNLKSDT